MIAQNRKIILKYLGISIYTLISLILLFIGCAIITGLVIFIKLAGVFVILWIWAGVTYMIIESEF
jgi:hypothetical protein